MYSSLSFHITLSTTIVYLGLWSDICKSVVGGCLLTSHEGIQLSGILVYYGYVKA